MRLRIISIVFRKELREMLRDRRSLAIMFGIPLVLYPMLTVAISAVGMSREKQLIEHRAKVAVVNGAAAPHLLELMSKPDSGVELTPAHDASKELAAGNLDAVVEVPPDAEKASLRNHQPPFQVDIDASRTNSAFAQSKINRLLNDYQQWIIEQRLRAHGQSPELLTPLKHTTHDIASADQRFGKMLAVALPVLLLMTGMLGALFPALNATTTERELGTLETLLVTPAGRMELLIAKGALVLLSALLTAGLNMLSMSLVLWRVLSLEKGLGHLQISATALALSYLAAVPSLICFATLVLIVGLLARNFREANSLATPVMLIPLASLLVGVVEPQMSPALLITPVANTTIIIREVLIGRITAGPFILSFVSSCVYAGLLLSAAARVFRNEQLVNPSWEPVSLKGFGKSRDRNRPRWRLPAVDESLALFAVTLLLTFYIQPSLLRFGFVPMLLISQIGLLAGPAILLAYFGGYRWIETFSWRKPALAALIAGLFLGVGLSPCMQALEAVQGKFWPPNSVYQNEILKTLVGPIAQFPILMPLLIGALAGLCEETLFRGPIQRGLLRGLSVWPAIVATALLFAAAHLDLYGMPIRTLLGIILGFVVVRTGSVFPAMLLHASYDMTQLFQLSHLIHHLGPDKVIEAAASTSGETLSVAILIGGIVLAGSGLMLLLTLPRRTSADAIHPISPPEPAIAP